MEKEKATDFFLTFWLVLEIVFWNNFAPLTKYFFTQNLSKFENYFLNKIYNELKSNFSFSYFLTYTWVGTVFSFPCFSQTLLLKEDKKEWKRSFGYHLLLICGHKHTYGCIIPRDLQKKTISPETKCILKIFKSIYL